MRHRIASVGAARPLVGHHASPACSSARSSRTRHARAGSPPRRSARSSGCTPSIGDKCVLSTDCSTDGDRLCDTSQPDGYCTQFNCANERVPRRGRVRRSSTPRPRAAATTTARGGYGSRVARSFCVAQCATDSDCRGGLHLRRPARAPWNGLVLDDDQAGAPALSVPRGLRPRRGRHAADHIAGARRRSGLQRGRARRRSTRCDAARASSEAGATPPVDAATAARRGRRRRDRATAATAARLAHAPRRLAVASSARGWSSRGGRARRPRARDARVPRAAHPPRRSGARSCSAIRRARPSARPSTPSSISTSRCGCNMHASLRGLATLDLGESVRRPGVSAVARVLDAIGPTASLAGDRRAARRRARRRAAVLGAGPWLGSRRGLGRSRARPRSPRRRCSRSRRVLTFALAARLRVVPLPGDPEAGAAGLLFASGLLSLAARRARRARRRAPRSTTSGARSSSASRAPRARASRACSGCTRSPRRSGPIVTVLGTQLGALLGGAVVLERLFERRGLGTLDPRGLRVARSAGARGGGRLLGRALRRRAAARRRRARGDRSAGAVV